MRRLQSATWRRPLRREEEDMLRSFIDTTSVGDRRWSPPLVDEERHAMCQAIYYGVEGAEWDDMHHKYVEPHKAVNLKKSGVSKNAKTLWPMRDAKANGEAYY